VSQPTYPERDLFRSLGALTRTAIANAQSSIDWIDSASAHELLDLASSQLGIGVLESPFPNDMSAVQLGNESHTWILGQLQPLFPSGTSLASELADQVQLSRAFVDPQEVALRVAVLVRECVAKFPRTHHDIRVGGNPGDVLDPFILAANFILLSNGDLARTIETTVSHKALMKIEDLLGNLHQDVLGAMRGNFRIAEPQRGSLANKEQIDPTANPFPGADLGQVPLAEDPERLRLFQIKSTTGYAKGGDGKRQGPQLKLWEDTYGRRTIYADSGGNPLRGHRS